MSIDSYKRPYQVRADYRRRDEIILSDDTKLRIDYGRNSITLKAQPPFNDYPTDDDLYVDLPPARMVASEFGIFEIVADLPAGTSLGFQVQREDGGDWLYYNGTLSSWTVASMIPTPDINTEAEVSEHLAELEASSFLRFRVFLRTTELKATPEVYGVNFSYLTRIDPYEDFLYRVVLPFFKESELWFNLEHVMNGTDDFIVIKLDNLGYQIEDVLAAYNLTTDPNRTTDISTGWFPAENKITLSGTPTNGDVVEVRMIYKADALSSAGVDYVELEKVPSYIVESASIERTYHNLDDCVRYKDDKRAEVFEFEQSDWTISVVAAAGRQVDLARMVKAIKAKIAESPFMYSYNFDEYYGLIWTDEPDFSLSREISDLREARFALEVQKVLLPLTEKGEPLVIDFKSTLIKGG